MSEEITFVKVIADNFQNILTVIGSIGGAVVGSIVTAKSSEKNDIKKMIHAKRTDLYFEFYEIVEELLNDRARIFEDEYLLSLIRCKAKIKLMASAKTYSAFEKYYNFVRDYNHKYKEYCKEKNPYSDPSKFEEIEDEDGEIYTECYVTSEDEKDFEFVKEQYIIEMTPDIETVRAYINPLYEAMRSDLGSEL